MAFTYDLNVITDHAAQTPFSLKEKLKSVAGWVVVESGDGTGGTFSGLGGGDVITTWHSTTSTTVANSINNRDAWFRIQDPNGQREFLYQTGSSWGNSTNCEVYYSASAGFTGGTPNASTRPTASDEGHVGGGRFANILGNGSERNVFDFIIGDADEEYSFMCLTRNDSGGPNDLYAGGLLLDVVKPFDPNDEDPAVIFCPTSSGLASGDWNDGRPNFEDTANIDAFGWIKKVKPTWQQSMVTQFIPQIMTDNTRENRAWDAPDPFTNEIVILGPAVWASTGRQESFGTRRSISNLKGESRFFVYAAGGEPFDITTDLLFLRFGKHLAVQWDGSTVPRI